MKKITLLVCTTLALVTISALTAFNTSNTKDISHRDGMSFKTGSPYDTTDCSKCHSGGLTTPMVTLSSAPSFNSDNTYLPGTTYTISVNCSGSYPKYGFDMEILNSNTTSAMDAGSFGSVITSNCQKIVTLNKPTNIVHTTPTGTSNAATFSFTWTAPASGTAYLYCCINGVDNNRYATGDRPKATNLTLNPSTGGIDSPEQNLFDVNIFPNPAYTYTTIDYTLKENNTHISIELYDISGKKAIVLLSEKQRSGTHHEILRLSEMKLKSGVYFAVLKAGDWTTTRKLLVK